MRRTLMSLAVLCIPSVAFGHAGIDASAFVLDPDRVGVTADESFLFRWFDASDIGTATASTTHSFFYTTRFPPPWPVFAAPEGLEGTPIAENVLESDETNAFTWSTATVAAGAYWIWSIANDPDLEIPSQTIVFSPYPVVIAHPGDDLHPYVVLTTPDSPASFAEGDRYLVEYEVFDPHGSATLTLERSLEGTRVFEPVQELSATSTAVEIDTSSWAEGDWIFRARLEDARQKTFQTFARFTLQVARARPGRDLGVGVDASRPDLASDDAGGQTGPTPPPPAPDCQCTNIEAAGSRFPIAAFSLVGCVLISRRRPRRNGKRPTSHS